MLNDMRSIAGKRSLGLIAMLATISCGAWCAAGVVAGTPETGPGLEVWTPPSARVFDDQFFLDGEARDEQGVAAVRVQGEDLLAPAQRGQVRCRFGRMLPLGAGTNTFAIEAEDSNGQLTSQTLVVVRDVPACVDDESRLTIAVSPLRTSDPAEPLSEALANRVRLSLERELLAEPARFRLVGQDEAEWEAILAEQELSASDLADPVHALRVGKRLRANCLLVGAVAREGAGATVSMSLIETESGRVVGAGDIRVPDAERELDSWIAGLVLKLEQNSPRVEGMILELADGKAVLDRGVADGVREGTRFLSSDGSVELVVAEVTETNSVARIEPPEAAGNLRAGDRFCSR